jgi:hypothetical protein
MLPEQEFKAALRAYLEAGPPTPEVNDLLQRLEMEMASPGDWESAKYQSLSESGKAEISD